MNDPEIKAYLSTGPGVVAAMNQNTGKPGDRTSGCKLDTDGDGNCHVHPQGCPPSEPAAGVDLPTNGIDLIAAERQRQVSQEGWTPEHDDQHDEEAISVAAALYAIHSWEWQWWKPRPDDRIRELVKAGALIAAEIDRLLRAQTPGLRTPDCEICGEKGSCDHRVAGNHPAPSPEVAIAERNTAICELLKRESERLFRLGRPLDLADIRAVVGYTPIDALDELRASHRATCNHRDQSIGGPGCICEVVNRNEVAELRAEVDTAGRCEIHNRYLSRLPTFQASHCPECLVVERDEAMADVERLRDDIAGQEAISRGSIRANLELLDEIATLTTERDALRGAAKNALHYMRLHKYADQAWADDLEAALAPQGAADDGK